MLIPIYYNLHLISVILAIIWLSYNNIVGVVEVYKHGDIAWTKARNTSSHTIRQTAFLDTMAWMTENLNR